nr:MAG TPA: hypothetical protein [Caudoviricetes sp.]
MECSHKLIRVAHHSLPLTRRRLLSRFTQRLFVDVAHWNLT